MREIKFRILGQNKHWCYFGVYIGKPDVATQPETLGQYTGLKDKNGVEIYEGDIDADGYVMTYEWACFRFRKGRKTKPYTPYRYGDVVKEGMLQIEVIGNIYENSELLEHPHA